MIGFWSGGRLRAAEAAAVAAASAEGDPDRFMRAAAHGIATLVLRHLGRAGLGAPDLPGPVPLRDCVRALAGSGVVGTRIVALVGPGNNGADGLYALAALARRGAACTAILLSERHHERAAEALRGAGGRLERLGTAAASRALGRASVVLDAALGTGARQPASTGEGERRDGPGGQSGGEGRGERGGGLSLPRAPSTAWRIACDLPSGVNADGGPGAEAPCADTTVALGAPSLGLLLGQGRALCGDVYVVCIPGLFDADVLGEPEVQVLSPTDAYDSVLSARASDHKYSRGVLGLIAGSPAYPGAAILCAKAALETGVGMLAAFSRGTARLQLSAHVPEAVVAGREQAPAGAAARRVNAWVLGSGLGEAEQDLEAARRVLASGAPAVVDASALAVVPGPHAPTATQGGPPPRPWILTPHAGELRALSDRLDLGLPDPARDPLGAARQAARATGCVVLLKGSCTLVATPEGRVLAAASAGPGLAVAGSGDTLAGILGALLVTHVARDGAAGTRRLATLAAAGAVIHGLAGAASPGPAEGLSAGIRSVLAHGVRRA